MIHHIVLIFGALAIGFVWLLVASLPAALSIPEDSRLGRAVAAGTWIVFALGPAIALPIYVISIAW